MSSSQFYVLVGLLVAILVMLWWHHHRRAAYFKGRPERQQVKQAAEKFNKAVELFEEQVTQLEGVINSLSSISIRLEKLRPLEPLEEDRKTLPLLLDNLRDRLEEIAADLQKARVHLSAEDKEQIVEEITSDLYQRIFEVKEPNPEEQDRKRPRFAPKPKN